jgi:hypothetical protein
MRKKTPGEINFIFMLTLSIALSVVSVYVVSEFSEDDTQSDNKKVKVEDEK